MFRVKVSTFGRLFKAASKNKVHVKPRLYGDYLRFSKLVADALRTRQPVVALESTIVTHGIPFPENLETAIAVENVVKDNDAVPATIAVLDGKIHVGLSEKELIRLAKGDPDIVKTSRRDLPFVLSQGKTGGTTVSGTMVAAHKAGLPIFVTGGVGGVHRGAENSMDVSADLTELGKTPVAVVSAGVKSILDIEKTLEYLETQGVCVATYGDTKEFPAFFTAHSGCQSPYKVSSPRQAALLIDCMLNFEMGSGMLIGVPIPEHHTANSKILESAIDTAIEETAKLEISGKDVTPYILRRLSEITDGLSVKANIALIKNNAEVGAQIACELAEIKSQSFSSKVGQAFHFPHVIATPKHGHKQQNQAVVIGGSNVDLTCIFKVDEIEENGGTYPGTVQQSFGGVGRNIADCLTRLGADPLFVSAVGGDTHAENMFHNCSHMNMHGVKRCPEHSTAIYNAILRYSGEVIYGVGDFNVHAEITPDYVSRFEQNLLSAPLVVMDGNIPAETMTYICDVCADNDVPVWFEPTDLRLVTKLFEGDQWQQLTYISPNSNELHVLNRMIGERLPGCLEDIVNFEFPLRDDPQLCDIIENCVRTVQPVLHVIPNVMVTLGSNGVLLCRNTTADTPFQVAGSDTHEEGLSIVHYPVRKAGQGLASIVSVSGAGDCLAGSMLWKILHHRAPPECITTGLLAAQKSLRSYMAVPNVISPETLSKEAVKKWMQMYCTPVVVA